MNDAPYDNSFDRLYSIFQTLLTTRSDLTPDMAAAQAATIYRSFTDALKPAA